MVLTDSNDKEIFVSAEMPVCIIKINRSDKVKRALDLVTDTASFIWTVSFCTIKWLMVI